ncbi:hypothetical protein HJG60_008184 [Phyllostomus discolor]|uniref:Uncharacterized protein n=1 Tax=Phyllostomus discolor TaxID=89673 RepID=A0A833Z3X0_9CHIR|nr:hypothetical protein HJG60_008184 [Phyllostomus discolor]
MWTTHSIVCDCVRAPPCARMRLQHKVWGRILRERAGGGERSRGRRERWAAAGGAAWKAREQGPACAGRTAQGTQGVCHTLFSNTRNRCRTHRTHRKCNSGRELDESREKGREGRGRERQTHPAQTHVQTRGLTHLHGPTAGLTGPRVTLQHEVDT